MNTQLFECLDTFFSAADPSVENQYSGDLSTADLRNADLAFANLQGMNLSKADLQGANLIGADLRGAKLNKVNLNNAKLKGANLSGAQVALGSFVNADLSGAILVESSFDGANFNYACLRGADLRGAYLIGADLSHSQLQRSYYSSDTRFGKRFCPKQANMLTDVQVTFGQAISQINLLSQTAQTYLGDMFTARYWEATRPEDDVLKQFKIKPGSAKIQFLGNSKKYLEFSDLQSTQLWVNNFILMCSQVIRHFPQLLEEEHINYMLLTL